MPHQMELPAPGQTSESTSDVEEANILDNDTASSLFPSRPEARVRSIVRAACGHDWTERFPHIREALAALRARSATIDGEAVVCCPETGLSLFDRLHSGDTTARSSCTALTYSN